jgi:hypothetical protein
MVQCLLFFIIAYTKNININHIIFIFQLYVERESKKKLVPLNA